MCGASHARGFCHPAQRPSEKSPNTFFQTALYVSAAPQRPRASPRGDTPYLNGGGRLKNRPCRTKHRVCGAATHAVSVGQRPSEKPRNTVLPAPKLRFQTAFYIYFRRTPKRPSENAARRVGLDPPFPPASLWWVKTHPTWFQQSRSDIYARQTGGDCARLAFGLRKR